jgi:hypothetical protein
MDDSPILRMVVMVANTLCFFMGITNLLQWYFYYHNAIPISESGGGVGSILRLQNDEIALLVLGVGTSGVTMMVAGMGLWGTVRHHKTLIRVATWMYTVVTVGSAMALVFQVIEVVNSGDTTTTGILLRLLLWDQRQEWSTVLGVACLAYPHHVLLRQYSHWDDHGPKKTT